MQLLLLKNFEVLIMNCIYKTNKYKMFLLIIIDVISLNIIFYVEFCFMKDENFSDYVWAFRVLRDLYIRLQLESSKVILSNDDKTFASTITQTYDVDEMKHELCVWHIEKNVIEYCKRYFVNIEKLDIFMKSFKALIYVSIEIIL